MRANQQSQSSEQPNKRNNHLSNWKTNQIKWDTTEWTRIKMSCGRVVSPRGWRGGVVAVLHPILWIAACSGLMGCGGSKCCPIMSSCLLLVCTVSQSHLHDYQHFAELGTVMVWCGLDGGEWRSLCGSSFSQVRLTLPVALARQRLC